MPPTPESPGGPSAASPSPSSPNFVVALSMGSPGGATPGTGFFSDATGAGATGPLRSPPTAEQPMAQAAALGDSRPNGGSESPSSEQQRDSILADTPNVDPEPLPSPAKPPGVSPGSGHPKGLPPLKRPRTGRQDSASQPSSVEHTRNGALNGNKAQVEHDGSPSGTVQPPSAKRARLASKSLARTASGGVSDAPAGTERSPVSGGATVRRPLGGPVLPPRPPRVGRPASAPAIPSWVQAAAEAPSVNAALIKAAAKCPPRNCSAAWQLGLDRDQRWSYVMHGAPGEVPGVDEDAPPMQGWAALHFAAATAPRDLAACTTLAEAIRLGQEQRQAAAEEAQGGDEDRRGPRSLHRRGLNLSELSAMISAAAAGHTARSAEEESLADRTRRVLRAGPTQRRAGRSAAAAAANGAAALALGRTLAEKMAQGGSAVSLTSRPQRRKPVPKPKVTKPDPSLLPLRAAKTRRLQLTKPAPKPKPKPKPVARPAAPAKTAPPLPPPLPSKEGVWTSGETWPRAALFSAGRGAAASRSLSLIAAAKNSDYDGEGTDMEAWKRLHEALRKAGQLPEPLPGR